MFEVSPCEVERKTNEVKAGLAGFLGVPSGARKLDGVVLGFHAELEDLVVELEGEGLGGALHGHGAEDHAENGERAPGRPFSLKPLDLKGVVVDSGTAACRGPSPHGRAEMERGKVQQAVAEMHYLFFDPLTQNFPSPPNPVLSNFLGFEIEVVFFAAMPRALSVRFRLHEAGRKIPDSENPVQYFSFQFKKNFKAHSNFPDLNGNYNTETRCLSMKMSVIFKMAVNASKPVKCGFALSSKGFLIHPESCLNTTRADTSKGKSL